LNHIVPIPAEATLSSDDANQLVSESGEENTGLHNADNTRKLKNPAEESNILGNISDTLN
jgi:hypothetical protein